MSAQDDDASIVQRQQDIEQMRARVEMRLQSLLKGDPLVNLRQQVHALRGSESRSVDREIVPEESCYQEESVLESQQEEQEEIPWTAERESLYHTHHVDSLQIRDPYGDEGIYTGMLVHNKPHGKGRMQYEDGRVYSGDWREGRWHGLGEVQFANGDYFKGNYQHDQRHGYGVYRWKDGRMYDGSFQNDQREGLGEYQWPDGACYKGWFRAGFREGEGTYRFADGSVYTGEWKEGKYHGLGECAWADGRVYKGEWSIGKAHGYGIEYRKDGTLRHDGEWNYDVPVRDTKKRAAKQRDY